MVVRIWVELQPKRRPSWVESTCRLTRGRKLAYLDSPRPPDQHRNHTEWSSQATRRDSNGATGWASMAAVRSAPDDSPTRTAASNRKGFARATAPGSRHGRNLASRPGLSHGREFGTMPLPIRSWAIVRACRPALFPNGSRGTYFRSRFFRPARSLRCSSPPWPAPLAGHRGRVLTSGRIRGLDRLGPGLRAPV
jgi:hypothetical protein